MQIDVSKGVSREGSSRSGKLMHGDDEVAVEETKPMEEGEEVKGQAPWTPPTTKTK